MQNHPFLAARINNQFIETNDTRLCLFTAQQTPALRSPHSAPHVTQTELECCSRGGNCLPMRPQLPQFSKVSLPAGFLGTVRCLCLPPSASLGLWGPSGFGSHSNLGTGASAPRGTVRIWLVQAGVDVGNPSRVAAQSLEPTLARDAF